MRVLRITCSECPTVFEHRNMRGGRPKTCSEPCRLARLRRMETEKKQRRGINTWTTVLDRTCRQCNAPFQTMHSEKVFCDNACKAQWHEDRRPDRNPVRRARYAESRSDRRPNRVGDTVAKLCIECDAEFAVTIGPGCGRHQELCSELCKVRSRRRLELRKYGITLEQYDDLWERQEGLCIICSGGLLRGNDKFAAVDHCHARNVVRGLLCARCNLGIGQFNDSVELLANAIDYLQREPPTFGRPVREVLAEAREIIARYEHHPA